jgi:type I restriction enzyme, S subunit
VNYVSLGSLFAQRVQTVDPAKFPSEKFELLSIPSYDVGQPEKVDGSAIGSAKKLVQPNDVLLSRIIPHIRRAWVVGSRNGARQIASSEWIVFRSSSVDPNYLRQFLLSDPFHVQMMQTVAGVGGSLLRARPDSVAQIKVPLPSIDEQRRVAAILDQADELRRKRRETIEKLSGLATSIVAGVLDQGDGTKRKTIKLKDYTDILVGFPFPSNRYVEARDGVRLCRGANVLPNRIDWSDTVYWSKSDLADYEEFELRTGDILIAMDRPWISDGFKVARLSSADLPSLLVQRVARLRPKDPRASVFLLEVLKTSSFAKHFKPTETTVPHISPNEIREFELPLEIFDQINIVSELLDDVGRLLIGHRTHLAKLDVLFASLQHRAFRGEL